MRRILRAKEAWAKVACGKTKFEEDYRHHSDDDPHVPGTDIARVKPIPLGERLIGFLEHEIDDLIDALAELRDARPDDARQRIMRAAIGAEGRHKVAERAPAKRACAASGRPSGRKRKSATARDDAARAAESVSASGVVK